MKAGGLQRTNSLFWFMACHMTAKVHIIQDCEQRVALPGVYVSLFFFYGRSRNNVTEILCEEDS